MLCSEKTYTTYVRSAHCTPSILGKLVLQNLASCKTGEPAYVLYKRVPPASSPPSLDCVGCYRDRGRHPDILRLCHTTSLRCRDHPPEASSKEFSVSHKTLRIRNTKQAGEGYSSNFHQTIRANITFRQSRDTLHVYVTAEINNIIQGKPTSWILEYVFIFILTLCYACTIDQSSSRKKLCSAIYCTARSCKH
jgi:hypothetical protein